MADLREVKRRGRPRLAADRALTSSVSVSLTATAHDRLILRAHREGISLSALIRRLLTAPPLTH